MVVFVLNTINKVNHPVVNTPLAAAVHWDVGNALGGQTASECCGPQDGQRQTTGK